jgi:hypothetical protein
VGVVPIPSRIYGGRGGDQLHANGAFILCCVNTKGPLGRYRSRWNDIRMDLREIVWEGVDRMHVVEVRDQW